MANPDSFSFGSSSEKPTQNILPKNEGVPTPSLADAVDMPSPEEGTKAGVVPEPSLEVSPEVLRREAAERVREKAREEEKPFIQPRPAMTAEDEELSELGSLITASIRGERRDDDWQVGTKLAPEERLAIVLATRELGNELIAKLEARVAEQEQAAEADWTQTPEERAMKLMQAPDQKRIAQAQALVKNAENMADIGKTIWFEKGATLPPDMAAKVEEIRSRLAADALAKEREINQERATPEYQARLAAQMKEAASAVAKGPARSITEDKTFVPEGPFLDKSEMMARPTETKDEQQARIRAEVAAQDVSRVFGTVPGERSVDEGKIPRDVEMMTRAIDVMEGRQNEPEEEEEGAPSSRDVRPSVDQIIQGASAFSEPSQKRNPFDDSQPAAKDLATAETIISAPKPPPEPKPEDVALAQALLDEASPASPEDESQAA